MSDDTARPFSGVEALRFGWQTTQLNLRPLITLAASGALLAFLGSALSGPNRGPAMNPFLGPGIELLQACVALAFIRVALKLHDGQPVDLTKSMALLEGFFPYLLTSVLYGLVVVGGLLLLVVPGVIWAMQFGFAAFLVVDAKLDPIEAMRESSRLTHGVKGRLFVFGLLLGLVNLVGALALGIGLFVTIPTTFIAWAYVFRRLQARAASTVRPAQVEPVRLTPTPATNP